MAELTLVKPAQNGLEWVYDMWCGSRPTWTKEPSTKVIKRIVSDHFKKPDLDDIKVEFLTQGGFNKIYMITVADSDAYIFRVSLPVDPYFKTTSEVNTRKMLREYTTIPIPETLAFDVSQQNVLGFEWTLMERMPGVTVEDMVKINNEKPPITLLYDESSDRVSREGWCKIPWDAKCKLVEDLVNICVQLFRIQTQSMGSVYGSEPIHMGIRFQPNSFRTLARKLQSMLITGRAKSNSLNTFTSPQALQLPEGYRVGTMVDMQLFWNQSVGIQISRGPFSSVRDWLKTWLTINKFNAEHPWQQDDESDDESDASSDSVDEDANVMWLVPELIDLLPKIFPPSENEIFTLHHDDMSRSNILIDQDTCELTALLDWECVSFVPLWKACEIPRILDDFAPREEEPKQDDFPPDEEGRRSHLYFEAVGQYEKTQLRDMFVDRMAEIEPKWTELYWSEEMDLRKDFLCAVENTGNGACTRPVIRWVKNFKAGKPETGFAARMRI